MRKGNYCISHIENMRNNDCITEKRYRELKDWGVFREEYSEISELSEGACVVLMRETDPEIEAKAIKTLGKQIEHGNIATAKQVKTILDNIRARVPTKGGDHQGAVKLGGMVQSGQDSLPNRPTLTMEDFLSQEKNKVGDVEDPEIDMEQDYYSGDAPITPDEQEKLEDDDVLPKPVVLADPEVKNTGLSESSDVEPYMQDQNSRVAQATKDLQKGKEDERERNEIVERNESNKTKNTLVTVLSGAMRTALHEGITRKEVFEALHIAIDSVFEPIESGTERKKHGSELASGGLFK